MPDAGGANWKDGIESIVRGGATCKGAWILGTACGRCQRCADDAKRIIPELHKRVDELEGALTKVMTGGNHLGLVIGVTHPPMTATHDEAHRHYHDNFGGTGAHERYEVWCAWRTIMEASAVLKKLPEPAPNRPEPMSDGQRLIVGLRATRTTIGAFAAERIELLEMLLREARGKLISACHDRPGDLATSSRAEILRAQIHRISAALDEPEPDGVSG